MLRNNPQTPFLFNGWALDVPFRAPFHAPWCVGLCTLVHRASMLGAFFLMLQRYDIAIAVFECLANFLSNKQEYQAAQGCDESHPQDGSGMDGSM